MTKMYRFAYFSKLKQEMNLLDLALEADLVKVPSLSRMYFTSYDVPWSTR